MMSCGIALTAMMLAPAQDPKPETPIEVHTGTLVIVNAVVEPTNPRPIDDAIEVMRALLIRKLGGGTAGAQPITVFGDLYARSDVNLSGTLGVNEANATNPFGNGSTAYRPVATVLSPRAEGVYLGGYGVVFTVTLPATGQDPLPGAGAAKESPTLTDWEREQRRLRGEPVPERTGVALKEPAIGDVLLKLLAENGKHFTSLKDDERVTIVVTFRASATHAKPVTGNIGSSATSNEQQISGTLSLSGGGTVSVVGQPQSVRDYELLGDLHLKNGQPKSAIDAYRKALELAKKEFATEGQHDFASEGQHDRVRYQLRDALSKLAQGHLAAGNMDDAQEVLKDAIRLGANFLPAKPVGKASASIRPTRLTISASKKLLDQIGNGKISLDEFRKQAMVEYVSAERQLKEPPAP